jgi:hypothetical protein
MRTLNQFGIEPAIHLGRLAIFDVEESSPAWSELQPLMADWSALDMIRTEFSVAELKQADHLQMGPGWHHGYPQPDDDFGYVNRTYNLQTYCPVCGIGGDQSAPFRMKREPKWGKRQILQLNWVFDEFFVQPQVWRDVFQPFGIEMLPVLEHRSGQELKTVVQLKIVSGASSRLLLGEAPFQRCESCHRTKYLPLTRGKFPAVAVAPDSQIIKTHEYFGSGGSAWNAIIISADLFRQIDKHKVKGVRFTPLEIRTI